MDPMSSTVIRSSFFWLSCSCFICLSTTALLLLLLLLLLLPRRLQVELSPARSRGAGHRHLVGVALSPVGTHTWLQGTRRLEQGLVACTWTNQSSVLWSPANHTSYQPMRAEYCG